ncbi:hypothetical protein SDRG_04097 [Saprolegnia diclina VS20]|uniref:EGF-like domain-containing protein n=1 Tax=Saprolegnia diclina (strain VS20) TaxID=1156394 RepID=T0QWI6_SAPDV|nr:hypothetical protein SDRG_04097 [Saprolegnia diclina VS20]EQC38385.1 hypothetical protein SDRG_04097 [Saprolegnia diclina VS20]|eukprot:XP_008607977.1 hypothetical protein SDRG_04097 [Saprolegnia diclina VS20]
MSYGCDPASHPTKEFIKAHISNYTDPKNPDIIVAGGASCNSNDDCTTVASVTGSCEKRRCKCADHWTGPRCTKYDLEATTYGPSVVLMGAMCGLAVLGSGAALLVRMRRNRAARQFQDEVNRRAKRSTDPSPSAESDVVRMQTA